MTEGRRLADRFVLVELLDPTGSTELWLAEDLELGERVAVRRLAQPLQDHWERLRDACRAARSLAHPRIARVFDFHRGDDLPFLTREYVDTGARGAWQGSARGELLAGLAQVCEALEVAHAQGVVHGDLKAEKILGDASGQLRVVDFGLAAALAEPAREAGLVRSSSPLASPQVRAGRRPEAPDDVYSLGALLAASLPLAELPRELAERVAAMGADEAERRPRDLGALRQALLDAGAASAPAAPARPVAPTPQPEPPPERAVLVSAPPVRRARPRSSRNGLYLAALGVLGLAALAVLFVLPRWVESGSPTQPSESSERADAAAASQPADAEGASAEAAQGSAAAPGAGEAPPAGSREEAETVLSRLLPLREELESQAVARWAPERFAEARAHEAEGDAALVEGRYGPAHGAYSEALAILEELVERRGEVLARSLADGDAALRAADAEGAAAHFELALAIAPSHPAGLEGAQRAAQLDRVLAYMKAGENLEAEGDPGAARDRFAKALEIDPKWEPAREARDRAQAAWVAREYDRNLSIGLVALADRDLPRARTHLEAARRLRPGSSEARDALVQLGQAETSSAVASRRRRAEAAERDGRFAEAVEHYAEILRLEGNVAFAQEGLERNRRLDGIASRSRELLADPKQLFEPTTLDEARLLVENGAAHVEGRPELTESLRRLEIAIRLASTPIPVEFVSDNLTEVVIRRVGSIGSFQRRNVPLKPGRYVAIGRRNGFRDVMLEISVVPGARPPVVELRCSEPI